MLMDCKNKFNSWRMKIDNLKMLLEYLYIFKTKQKNKDYKIKIDK